LEQNTTYPMPAMLKEEFETINQLRMQAVQMAEDK
jgi:hypothetical protein